MIPIMSPAAELLRVTPIFNRMTAADRQRIADVARVQTFGRADTIFEQDSPSTAFYAIVSGRVKIFKTLPSGRDVILEVFGPGDPLGAVAVYMDRPFPASAAALEDTTCVVIPRDAFYRILEAQPLLVRGLLLGLTTRLVELTNQLAELSGGHIEPRFARLFLKLAGEMGQAGDGGVRIPLALSRQELADFTGTTVETCIRIMSRWNKSDVVRTTKGGFIVVDRKRLERIAAG